MPRLMPRLTLRRAPTRIAIRRIAEGWAMELSPVGPTTASRIDVAERCLEVTPAFRASLTAALRKVAASRRVILAIDAPLMRVRELVGIPASLHPALVTAAVRTAPERFFIANQGELTLSSAYRDAAGKQWMAAMRNTDLLAVAAACRAAGSHLLHVESLDSPAIRVTAPERPSTNVTPRRARAAAGVLLVGSLLWLTVPIAVGSWNLRAVRARVQHAETRAGDAMVAYRELSTLMRNRAELEHWHSLRSEPLRVLAELAGVLPSHSHLVRLVLDSTGAEGTIVSRDAQGLLQAFDSVRSAIPAEVVGSLEELAAGGGRARVRFPSLRIAKHVTRHGGTTP